MIIPQRANLKLWMPMQLVGGNLTDRSGTTIDANIAEVGSSIQSTTAKLGFGTEFLATSADSVLVANAVYDFTPSSSWTFSFFVKHHSTDFDTKGILSNLDVAKDTGYLIFCGGDNLVHFTVGGSALHDCTIAKSTDIWKHYTWTRASQVSTVYVNGTSANSTTQTVTYGIQTRYQGIHFGQYRKGGDGGNFWSKSNLNHVMVWDTALTAKEVAVLYNSHKRGQIL